MNILKKKNICMVALASYPGDPRIRRQAEALEKAGYSVDILCRYSPVGTQPKVEKFGKITAYRLMHAPRQENMANYLVISTVFFFVAFFKIQKLFYKNRYSIIQAHNMPDHLIFIGIIQKLFGVKLILDIHDLTVELFEEKWSYKRHSIFKFLVKGIERISCNFTDSVITVTSTCKERLISRGVPEKKITLVLNTPDSNIFKLEVSKKYEPIYMNAKLVYHGTIAYRFGLHLAIEAMPIILRKIPESQLMIYGVYDAEYKSILEEKIKFLRLNNSVILKGIISRESIPGILHNSDIGIVPYLNTDYMNLALPTKAFEYIATGLPVVSSLLNDLSKTFSSDSISYFEDNNSQLFAEKVIQLCLDPGKRKKQVEKAYEELKLISGKVMAERYVALVDRLFNF